MYASFLSLLTCQLEWLPYLFRTFRFLIGRFATLRGEMQNECIKSRAGSKRRRTETEKPSSSRPMQRTLSSVTQESVRSGVRSSGEDPFLTLTCGKCLMKKNDCRKLPFWRRRRRWRSLSQSVRHYCRALYLPGSFLLKCCIIILTRRWTLGQRDRRAENKTQPVIIFAAFWCPVLLHTTWMVVMAEWREV